MELPNNILRPCLRFNEQNLDLDTLSSTVKEPLITYFNFYTWLEYTDKM